MQLKTTHTVSNFGGIDNINDPIDLVETTKEMGTFYFLSSADNADLTDNRSIERRDGYRIGLTLQNPIHSLWSNEQDCFFISGASLYRLNEDFSYTVLLSGLSGRPMVFTSAFGDVYFTDGIIIGYISAYALTPTVLLPAVVENFKAKMPAGHLITFYRTVLYVAVNDMIFCSDPLKIRQYDIRKGIIPQLGRITMLQALDDALWISDDKAIYCLSGNTIYDFVNYKKSDFPALENGSLVVNAENTSLQSSGKAIIMATRNGFYAGVKDGSFVALTKKHYHIPETFVPTGMGFQWRGDKHQCFLSGKVYPSTAAAHIMVSSPALDTSIQTYQPWSLPSLQLSMTGTTL
jgi:hypothetical protein